MAIRSNVTATALSVCSLFACASAIQAAAINYGDFSGATVNFLQVTEDSGTDPTPVYGSPSVFGNSLDFNPLSFNASASGSGGVDITDGTLTLMMTSNPGHFIDCIKFDEAGDYTLAGFGTAATAVSVTANFNIEIQEVDGVAIGSILVNPVMNFTPSNGDFDLANDAGGGPAANGSWAGMLMADLTQVLIDNNIPYVNGVTKVSVTFDNTLVATSEDGTSAFIAKKDVGGVGITVIPEPASLGLLTLGGLCMMARRR